MDFILKFSFLGETPPRLRRGLGSVRAMVAGVATATKERKTMLTCAVGIIFVGLCACCVGGLLLGGSSLAMYLAAFTSGLQNALLTTFTGFMRTTHMTGTITDVGLLFGQAYPDHVQDQAHWWKTRVLSSLVVTWIIAGLAALTLILKFRV